MLFGLLSRFRSQHTRKRTAPRGFRPLMEVLEDRCVLSIITVTNNIDSGTGSLRAAIASASAGDTITFASGGLADTAATGSAQTIKLTSGSLVPAVNVAITATGAPAVSIVSSNSRIFDFPLSSPSSLTAVTLQGLTLNGTANDGTTGGAIHIATISAFALTIDSCTITGALGGAGAATRGGAISVTGFNDSLTVTNCAIMGTVSTVNTVSNNDAGALYVATNQMVSVSNSTLSGSVTGSTTSNEAGAVYQNAGTLTLTSCTISGSSAGRGGGFYQQGGSATLTDCTISGNTATTNGGGVYIGKGTLNLLNCTIANNTAGNKGGGITAFFHSSNGTGGTSITNLTNCTISGNTAATAAGLYVGYINPTTGINPTGKNTVTANNTIIAGSVVRQTGGVITDSNEQLNASNSLFDTTPTTGAGMTLNGTNTNNLFGQSPLLGTLQNNGGSVQTLALAAGSPALDAGSNALASAAGLTTDQRGFNRVVNSVVDIGAYEYQPPATTTTVNSSPDPSQVGQSVTVTATVAANAPGSNDLEGTVTFSVDGISQATVTLSSGMATFTTSSLTAGSHTITAMYNGSTQNADPFSTSTASLTQTVTALPVPATPVRYFAVGAGAGGSPQVVVYNAATQTAVVSFYAFTAAFTGGVRVAVGDVNGDGTPDIIAGAGPGGGPEVRVFDGTTFAMIRDFFALPTQFTGGVYEAAGDVNGDGFADIITSADAGGGPQVTITSGRDATRLASFYATASTFTGGIRVAAGDVNGDGFADVIAAAGPGGGPQVTIFDGKSLSLLTSFYALPSKFTGGLYVAAGDLTGDGKADIIAGADRGSSPEVALFNGPDQKPLATFYALPSKFTGGVRVAAVDTGSGRDSILTAAGPGGGPQVAFLDGLTLQTLSSFFAYPSTFSGGVFVGG